MALQVCPPVQRCMVAGKEEENRAVLSIFQLAELLQHERERACSWLACEALRGEGGGGK